MSGADDSLVKVWNLRSGVCLQTIQGQGRGGEAVRCLQSDGLRLVAGFGDLIKVWEFFAQS